MRYVPAVTALILLAASLSAQEASITRLNDSPRHHEWVTIGGPHRSIRAFVVYPEVSEKVPVILVIHENRGLNDWARSVADQLAAEGFIAVAPDMLSGMAPGGGHTANFPDTNAARDAIYQLSDEQVLAELAAVADYALALEAGDGTLAVAGFCWGGHRSFQFAAASDEIDAAYVFYGTPPDPSEYAKIDAPVYGFYGENDARVTSTVPASEEAMRKAGKTFEPVIYEGAGHGFMRSGEGPDAEPANVEARDAAWERWLELLARL